MSVVHARQQLQAAAIAEGGALDPEVQAALGEALARVSPVDAVVGAFNALRDHVDDLGDALTEGLRLGAVSIAESDFYGLAADAAALAATLPEPEAPAP